MKEGSKTSIILVLDGDGHGHGTSMDTGPMPLSSSSLPTVTRGFPGSPGDRGVLPSQPIPHTHPQQRHPGRGWKTQDPTDHTLTVPLKDPVTAGQRLQEFCRGRQRTLGFKAEVYHT